jgi:hypothetical protein
MRLQKNITVAAIITASLFSVANAQEAQNPTAPMTNYVGSPMQAAGEQPGYLAQMIDLQPLLSAAPQPSLGDVLQTLGVIEAQPSSMAPSMAAPAAEESGPIRGLLNSIRNR